MSDFSQAERAAVYRAIYERRDIRAYRPDPVPEDVLKRILDAAHNAGSVGFMQPWSFLVLHDRAVRQQIYDHFREVNTRAADRYSEDRKQTYQSLKLQGILDAPLNVLITCDPTRGGPDVLGRATIRETDLYSTCLAVQNFWLAARAEGVGAGWMSLMQPEVVREILGLPEQLILVAYMTVGYPVQFRKKPLLSSVGWRQRLPVEALTYLDRWGAPFEHLPPPPPPAPRADLAPPDAAVERLANLTRPPGSLGALDEVALQVCGVQGRVYPATDHKWLLLAAGDHGVTAEGVSAYRPSVTAQMVYQFVAGGAAVNAFARQHGIEVVIADLGVDHDFGDASGVAHKKVRRGTRNLAVEAAMTAGERDAAVAAGADLVREIPALDLLALGEMGIGNSTSAAALACALLGLEPADFTGRGTGVGDKTRARKVAAIERALALLESSGGPAALSDPLEALRCLGGYEIAALVGAIQAAAARRAVVVLDGFITGVAALVACRIDPKLRGFLVAGHCSAEPAHAPLLSHLGLRPLLDLELRLGEGSGAALAVGLVEAACRTLREMRTFEEAGIEHPLAPGGRE
jgi:nicotinate-nucleotide--dimethylbenzimidazole phosphoribosyltransferase